MATTPKPSAQTPNMAQDESSSATGLGLKRKTMATTPDQPTRMPTMAQDEAPSATGLDPECKIGFFDLSRELRDAVYDLTWKERYIPETDLCNGKEDPYLSFSADFNIRAAIPQAFRVSKQFSSEYIQRYPANSILQISDDASRNCDGTVPKTPRLAIRSTHVVLDLFMLDDNCRCESINCGMPCWQCDEWRRALAQWESFLQGIPTVRSVSMKLAACPCRLTRKIVENALSFPRLVSLDFKMDGGDVGYFASEPLEYFVRWTREKGLWLDNIEKATSDEAFVDKDIREGIGQQRLFGHTMGVVAAGGVHLTLPQVSNDN